MGKIKIQKEVLEALESVSESLRKIKGSQASVYYSMKKKTVVAVKPTSIPVSVKMMLAANPKMVAGVYDTRSDVDELKEKITAVITYMRSKSFVLKPSGYVSPAMVAAEKKEVEARKRTKQWLEANRPLTMKLGRQACAQK